MASYLKPRRGAYSAISASTLQSGEIFFETPTIGGARGKIMMGNGSTRYANQTYFLDLDTSGITFTNPTASVSTSFTNGVSAYAASYGSGQSLPNIIRSMKQALINAQAMLAKLNNEKEQKCYYKQLTSPSVTIASKTYGTTTVANVAQSGYTCYGASLANVNGGGGGYLIITCQTNGNLIIYNPYSSSVTVTITVRYFFKQD
jgi:hypothetical protein